MLIRYEERPADHKGEILLWRSVDELKAGVSGCGAKSVGTTNFYEADYLLLVETWKPHDSDRYIYICLYGDKYLGLVHEEFMSAKVVQDEQEVK